MISVVVPSVRAVGSDEFALSVTRDSATYSWPCVKGGIRISTHPHNGMTGLGTC